ncbi:hypothetical protein ACIFOE_04795 [Paenibacillus sp. NRS-1783]|uniref:hypothetical protein n=1 Tax=Paenibacillus sp. NRS-1783 TaxID=3233907 RepID=UPI003D2BE06E
MNRSEISAMIYSIEKQISLAKMAREIFFAHIGGSYAEPALTKIRGTVELMEKDVKRLKRELAKLPIE